MSTPQQSETQQGVCVSNEFSDKEGVVRDKHTFDENVRKCIECGADEDRVKCLQMFPVGQRVRLKQDVERYPHFIAEAGRTGVVAVNDEEMLAVTMDEKLEGAEEWDNQVCWIDYTPDCTNVFDDLEVV